MGEAKDDQATALKGEPVLRRMLRGLVSAAALGFVVTFVIASLDAAGVTGLRLAYLYLAGAWLVGVVGTYVAESIWVLRPALRWTILIAVAGLLGLVCVAMGVFEMVQYRAATATTSTPVSAAATIPQRERTRELRVPPPAPLRLVAECVGAGLPRQMPQDGHFREMAIFHGPSGGAYGSQEGPAGSPVA